MLKTQIEFNYIKEKMVGGYVVFVVQFSRPERIITPIDLFIIEMIKAILVNVIQEKFLSVLFAIKNGRQHLNVVKYMRDTVLKIQIELHHILMQYLKT